MMNSKSNLRVESENPWDNCPPGTLGHYQSLASAQSRRAQLKVMGGVATALCGILLVVGLASLLNPAAEPDLDSLPSYGGLACQDVAESMSKYFAKTLDVQHRRLTTRHLLDCPKCLEMYTKDAQRLGVELDLTLAQYSPTTNFSTGQLMLGSCLGLPSPSHR